MAAGEDFADAKKAQDVGGEPSAGEGIQATGIAVDGIPVSPLFTGPPFLERAAGLAIWPVALVVAFFATSSAMTWATDDFPEGVVFWPVLLAMLIIGMFFKAVLFERSVKFPPSGEVVHGPAYSRKKIPREAIRVIQLLYIGKVALNKRKPKTVADVFEVNLVLGDPPAQRLHVSRVGERAPATRVASDLGRMLGVPVIEQTST